MARKGTYFISFLRLRSWGWDEDGEYSSSRTSLAVVREVLADYVAHPDYVVIVNKDGESTYYRAGRKIDPATLTEN